MSKPSHGHRETIHSVTNAPISPRDDQHQRMVRYFTSMTIRTGCFVMAFVFIYYLHLPIPGWICAVGALILPYVAVVMANATRGSDVRQASPLTPSSKTRRQLTDREHQNATDEQWWAEQPHGPDDDTSHNRP